MKIGDTIVYTGASDAQVTWGKQQMGCDDPRRILVEGAHYEIKEIEVDDSCTAVSLVNIKGRFNSVCFEVC